MTPLGHQGDAFTEGKKEGFLIVQAGRKAYVSNSKAVGWMDGVPME